MANQGESNQDKLNRKLLEDLISEIFSDILGGIIIPAGDRTLHELIEYPEVDMKRASKEDVDSLVNFVCSHMTYKIKDKTATDGFLGKTILDIANDPMAGRSIVQAKLKEVLERPSTYFEISFNPSGLPEKDKKEYGDLLRKVYGVDKIAEGQKIPIRLKQDVIDNPSKYLSTRVDFNKIYAKHKKNIDMILADYAAAVSGDENLPEVVVTAEDRPGAADASSLVPSEILGQQSRGGKNIGRFSRFWHTNPFSPFGEIYRRAKKNRKLLRKEKIGPWEENFKVGEENYDLEDPDKLNDLPLQKKIHLGREYHKRRLRDYLLYGALVLSCIPELTGFGLWVNEKYFKKTPNTPPAWEYIWSGFNPPEVPPVQPERTYAPSPPPPAPVYTEAGCRDMFPCPPPEYSEGRCRELFPIPGCDPEIRYKDRILYKDKECPPPPACPPQKTCPPCNCEGRVIKR